MLKQLSIYDFDLGGCSRTKSRSNQGIGIDSPSLTLSVSDTSPPSLTLSVSDTQPKALLRFLNRAKQTGKGGVGTYQPSGLRKAQYFRFSYRIGNRTKHRHIPGGNIHSDLALNRAKKIQAMADREVSIENILQTIGSFS